MIGLYRTFIALCILCEEIACGAVEVLRGIARIDAERTGSIRHQLAKTVGTLGADGSRIVAAFGLDQGLEKDQPVVLIETDVPQGTVPLVPVSSRADQGEDVVASGRRCGIQRGENLSGLSAIIQPCPGRSFAMKGPA